MNTLKKYYEAIDGPSRDRLIDAFKYAYDKGAEVPVKFRLVYGYTMPKNDPGCAIVPFEIVDVRLIGLEHEDGSGESFNLMGYCRSTLEPVGKAGEVRNLYFRGWFHTRTRKGTFRLAEDGWPE